MPAIAREQENTPSILNWFTTINGTLTDMYAVEFQIWDITGGLPGTVVFPTPGDDSAWEDVTSGVGHYSVGHYYAYDNTGVVGWTPGIGEPIGTHRIKWRWKASAAAPYQSDSEDFEVLSQSGGSSADWYISLQDVRDAGLLEATYPDADVIAAIEMWQQFIERACRQWFNPRTMILQVDGTNSDALHFGVPIISIDYLKINNRADEMETTYYEVYSGNQLPDDRGNPRIKLIGPDHHRDIYLAPVVTGRLKFRKGRRNQEIKGTFGYVEPDGSTPKMIKRALLKLVIEKLTTPVYSTGGGGSSPSLLGIVLSEETDGHKRKYGYPGGQLTPRRSGLSGITQDPEILDIIKLYRAPLGVASPAHWSYL